MPRRYYSSIAAQTTLSSGIDGVTTTVPVTSVLGWPSSFPYTLIIDKDTVNEEIVTVTARSGTTLTVTRGSDGTSAISHSAGANVQHGVSARDFDEPNAFINGTGVVTNTMLAADAVTTGKIADGTIVNADINAAAAIDQSKVASLTADLAAKFPLNVSTNVQTASYTLVASDAQKIIEMNLTPVPITISNIAIDISTSVVTVTTSTNHGLVSNERAFISNLTNSNSMYNGSWAVTGAPTLTTFTFVHTNGTLANRTVTNVALTSNVATLTTSTAHGFTTGDTVVVSGVTNNSNLFNGTYTVTGTPTATTFTYAKTNANIGSAAATGTPLVYASSAAATGTSPNVYEEALVIIPLDSSVNFPIGTSIVVVRTGAGQTNIAGVSGVTVNSFLGLKIIGQWAGCTLVKRAANTWVAVGGLVA